MPRRRPIAIGVVVIVAGGLAGLWFSMAKEPISRANFERIHEGMTERMVEEVLGGPARDYRKRRLGFLHIEYIGKEGEEKAWHGDLGSVFVWFNEKGPSHRQGLHRLPGEREFFRLAAALLPDFMMSCHRHHPMLNPLRIEHAQSQQPRQRHMLRLPAIERLVYESHLATMLG